MNEMPGTQNLQYWSKQVVAEIARHATEEGCPQCKLLIAQLMTVYGLKVEDLIGKEGG